MTLSGRTNGRGQPPHRRIRCLFDARRRAIIIGLKKRLTNYHKHIIPQHTHTSRTHGRMYIVQPVFTSGNVGTDNLGFDHNAILYCRPNGKRRWNEIVLCALDTQNSGIFLVFLSRVTDNYSYEVNTMEGYYTYLM